MTNHSMYTAVFHGLLPWMATSFLLPLNMAWNASTFGHIRIMSMKPFLMSSLTPKLSGTPLSWAMSSLMYNNGNKTILKWLTSFLPLQTMNWVNIVIALKLLSTCILHVSIVTTLITILINVWSMLTQLKFTPILLPSLFLKPSI
jgi:hypothetical protein